MDDERLDNIYDALVTGLPSQRERIATALAAGMLANASIPAEISNVNIIGEAVVLADALIAALEGTEK